MASGKSHNRKKELQDSADEGVENAKEITHDLVDYIKDYASENPGTVALWCLGIGFVIGWKMKP